MHKVSHSITKSWTTRCCSINKLNESLKIFPDFSLSAMIFQEISLRFPGFLRFFNFSKFSPDFPRFSCFCWESWRLQFQIFLSYGGRWYISIWNLAKKISWFSWKMLNSLFWLQPLQIRFSLPRQENADAK